MPPPVAVKAAPLNPVEVEVIRLFVQLTRAMGHRPTIGEVYGLLFISGRPLAIEELLERLRLSRSSADQGLKFLGNLGAIRMVYVAGDRQPHYEAVAELRNLVARFLRDHIVPHLDNGQAQLERVGVMVKQLPPEDRERTAERLKLLQSWMQRGEKYLPLFAERMGA
jgi:DNA-binding transcriptional regulator GbsR (MarR family)